MNRTIAYNVPLIPQPNVTSCWAASMAMVVSYRDRNTTSPGDIAAAVGLSLESSYGWGVLYDAARRWRLTAIPAGSFTGEGWWNLLDGYGPLWLVEVGNPSHAVVLTGGDGDTFILNNPWPPNVGKKGETRTLATLDADFGGALSAVGNNMQILHG